MSAAEEKDLPELPEGWVWARLEEIATTSSGGTPNRKRPDYFDGDIPWLKIGDLTDGAVAEAESTITQAGLDASAAKWLRAGTLLVAMYGSIGKLGLLEIEATTNQAICAVQASSDVDPRYLFWWFFHQRPALMRHGRGGTQLNISQGDLKRWLVPVAPRPEQARIVETIEALARRVTDARGRLLEASERLPDLQVALRGSAFELPESEAPIKRLDEVGTIQSGLAKGRPAEGAAKEVPFIATVNVQAGRLDLSHVKRITVSDKQIERHSLRDGDVLVLEGGDADKVGRGWIWDGQVDGALHQNHVFAVRPRDEVLLPRYLAHYINAGPARRYFLENAKQTTNLASINKSVLSALPIPVPSLAEQKRIAADLDSDLGVAAAYSVQLAALEQEATALQATVLHAAFTGQLGTHDPSDEPASVLLERIRAEREAAEAEAKAAKKAGRAKRKPAEQLALDGASGNGSAAFAEKGIV